MHPLKYIAETLSQMARALRDFEMQDSAQLLEKAKSDIDSKLSKSEIDSKLSQNCQKENCHQ
jgi:hypothetical protein